MAEVEIDVQGPPGSGKTRQIQYLADGAMLESGPQGFGAVTFTRAAARELRSRLGHRLGTTNDRVLEKAIPYVGTIHSLAWRLLDRPPVVSRKLLREFAADQRIVLKNVSESDFDSNPEVVDAIQFQEASANMDELELMRAMLSGIRSRLWNPEDEIAWAELLPERTPPGITLQRLVRLSQKYTEWKHLRGLVDFEDMLEHGRELCLPVQTLFLDEAQDCTPLLWSVIDAWANPVKTFIAAGDPYQCQPPGTRVLTTDGPVPIETLDPERHRLVSYDRHDSELRASTGYAFTIQQHAVRDVLYDVRVGDAQTSATGNHRWYVRWDETARLSKYLVTYLMRRGERWRVGWCQMFNSQGQFHLFLRGRMEKTDAIWILGVHKSRSDASVDEQYLATQYGLPTITFEPVSLANHLTREAIDAVFDQLDPLEQRYRAHRALADRCRHPDHPLWERRDEGYGRRQSQVVCSYNLEPELMLLPAVGEGKRAVWSRFTLDRRAYTGPVYSLDVPPHHLYVADGIVTHNSIYLFGGANPVLFRDRPGRWLRLAEAHRFNRQAADYAKMILRMGGWTSARDEDFHNAWEGVGPSESDGSTFWLARTNRLLDPIRAELQAQGMAYAELRGRAPLQTAAAQAFVWLQRYLDGNMLSAAAVRQILEQLEPAPHGALARAKRLTDGAMLGPPEVDGVVGAPLAELWGTLPHADYFDSVWATYGPKAFREPPQTRIGTIHASKGLQADTVRLVRSWAFLPARNALRNPEEEALVAYVASTRHRNRLELIDGHQGLPYAFPD